MSGASPRGRVTAPTARFRRDEAWARSVIYTDRVDRTRHLVELTRGRYRDWMDELARKGSAVRRRR